MLVKFLDEYSDDRFSAQEDQKKYTYTDEKKYV